jgi:hypothetical protein
MAVALFAGLSTARLTAGMISGTFTIDGSVTVTAIGINWTSNSNVSEQATISSSGLSGSFVGMADDTVTINNLINLPGDQPVGMTFPNYNFLDFLSAPTYPELLTNYIALGSGNPATCSTNVAAAAAGQTCTLTPTTTPPEPGGSPFTFLNTNNGTGGCCNSSATWDISGVTSSGKSTWNAVFTSEFTVPFQSVLNTFVSTGSVADSFSGALVVTLTPIVTVPEPTTLGLMGAGVLLIWVGSRKRKKA